MIKSTNSQMVSILVPRNKPRLPPISPANENEIKTSTNKRDAANSYSQQRRNVKFNALCLHIRVDDNTWKGQNRKQYLRNNPSLRLNVHKPTRRAKTRAKTRADCRANAELTPTSDNCQELLIVSVHSHLRLNWIFFFFQNRSTKTFNSFFNFWML